jgi:hypothetical protein
MVFLLPAWANRPKEYKKGGRVKKDKVKEEESKKEVKKKSKKKSEKDSGLSQSVNVNVKIGDSVLLHKGNVPKTDERKARGYTSTGRPIGRPRGSGYRGAPLRGPTGGPEGLLSYGVLPGGGNPPVKRFVSPGNSYGAMPGPLQSGYYGSPPNVANPTSVFPYAGSGSALWNYNRNKNDDVPQIVNPSDIKSNTNPSTTLVRNEITLSPMRYSQSYKESAQVKPYQMEMVRITNTDSYPSKRIVPSQPSAASSSAYLEDMDGEEMGVEEMGVEESMVSEPIFSASSTLAEASAAPKPKKKPSVGKGEAAAQPLFAAAEELSPAEQRKQEINTRKLKELEDKIEARKAINAWVKTEYPTKKSLTEAGYSSYKQVADYYAEIWDEGSVPALRRGGRVHSCF